MAPAQFPSDIVQLLVPNLETQTWFVKILLLRRALSVRLQLYDVRKRCAVNRLVCKSSKAVRLREE